MSDAAQFSAGATLLERQELAAALARQAVAAMDLQADDDRSNDTDPAVAAQEEAAANRVDHLREKLAHIEGGAEAVEADVRRALIAWLSRRDWLAHTL